MVKICQKGFLKLYFEILPEKHFLRFLPKNSQAMDEFDHFLPIFKSFGP